VWGVDELIKGRRTLLTDDLEQVEAMTVQLEEAKTLIERDTVNHARLAFILLDNAAEVLMRRAINVLLTHNPVWERMLDQWKEILAQQETPEARQRHDEVEREIVPRAERVKLSRYFDPKVDFLEARDHIEPIEGKVLKKLHRYRNELYHRGHARLGTVKSACLLYFDLVLSLFERLRKADMITVAFMMDPPPLLQKYNPPGTVKGYPSVHLIAQQLRSDLGISSDGLKEVLLTHLTSRLDQLDRSIASAQRIFFAGFSEVFPSGPWKDGVVRLAQVHETDPLPDSLDALLARTDLKYELADLAQWRQAVDSLQQVSDKLELFAGFADIEDAFEEFETQLNDMMERIDLEMQTEEEMQQDAERIRAATRQVEH
jgi:hypothetical protein